MSKRFITGFTVFELLIVIGILVITATLGAMFVRQQIPKLRLYTTAHELAETLERARRLTVSEQTAYGISFNQDNQSYSLVKLSPSPVVISTVLLPQNITIASTSLFTNNTAVFNAAGGAVQSGEIIIRNNENQEKTVIINPSGYVQAE